jgi:hypothetical protein
MVYTALLTYGISLEICSIEVEVTMVYPLLFDTLWWMLGWVTG